MRNKPKNSYKREVFLASLDNLVKSAGKIGLNRAHARNVKSVLGWAKGIIENSDNGKV